MVCSEPEEFGCPYTYALVLKIITMIFDKTSTTRKINFVYSKIAARVYSVEGSIFFRKIKLM